MFDKVLIATFSVWVKGRRTSINGMIEPMLSFFLPKTKIVDLIDGPHPDSSTVISHFERYEEGKYKKTRRSYFSLLISPLLKIQNSNATRISFKIRDFFSIFEWVVRSRLKYSLFIGLESVYTLAGIFLKKLGLVKKVVYYVSDYSPCRYQQRWFNTLYLFLDRTCCYHCDFIWDVSPVIKPARIKAGLNPSRSAPVILVPNALFPQQISHLPIDKIKPFTLVFAGTFGPENGVSLAIAAMKKITKKFPQAKLHIIGGDHEFEAELKNLVKEYKLEKNVIFHGFVKDAIKLSNIIREFAVGLAPYISFPDSARWWGDATKIRLYLAAGLPVVTTQVPPLGKEIQQKGAGIIVDDHEEDLASAVIRIFSDQILYQKMRQAAISFAKENTWENSYKNALLKMGEV